MTVKQTPTRPAETEKMWPLRSRSRVEGSAGGGVGVDGGLMKAGVWVTTQWFLTWSRSPASSACQASAMAAMDTLSPGIFAGNFAP
jgi:hypothetical protein